MPSRGVQTLTQYGIQTTHSKSVLMVTEDLEEAIRMLELIGQGRLIERTISYRPWHAVDVELPASS